jgi:hypothetical protein
MILAGNSVKGDRRQQQPGLAHRAAGGGAAPSAPRGAGALRGAIRPPEGFGYTRRHR